MKKVISSKNNKAAKSYNMETGGNTNTHAGKKKSISRRYVMITVRTLKGEGITTCLQNEGILREEARLGLILAIYPGFRHLEEKIFC